MKKEKCKTKISVNMNSQHNNQPVFAGMIIFGYVPDSETKLRRKCTG